MKTIRLTMAQALIRFLENQYVAYDDVEHRFVKGMFMLPGHGNVVGLCQGIEQEIKDIEIYQGKNEQGQAQAAMAFAKHMHRKQIMACTSSVGPGAANMVTAAATATANNIPLLLLPGDIYVSRQPDPVLQQIEQTYDLSISTNDAFKPVCRYWDRISRPEQIMTAMISAMRVLTDPANTGAVCIALPQDVQGEAYDYPVSFFEKRVWEIERRPATKKAIELATKAIKESKKPIIVCGGGVRYSEANDTLRAFAEKFNIPFGETQAGKSAIVWDHPLNLGGIGTTGCAMSNRIAADADLVIGIGTRYTDFTTASKWLFRNTDKFVNINVSEFQAHKMDAIPVIADAKVALEELMVTLDGYKSAYTTEIETVKADWNKELEFLANASYEDESSEVIVKDDNRASVEDYVRDVKTKLTQTSVIATINRLIPEDASIIGASGSLPGCLQRMWCPKSPNTYNMEYGYSCMGYEISGALGVKLAIGDEKEVFCMVGDGSFHMMHSELITAIQERKKVNIMLFDNSNYGCINNLQVSKGNESRCTEMRFRAEGAPHDGMHKGEFLNIDFAKVAEGYGCKSYSIYTLEDLENALIKSKTETRPVLFDIKVLPKTMTDEYDAWWRTGVSELSDKQSVKDAYKDLVDHLAEARKY